MKLPKIIDNRRNQLVEVIRDIAPEHDHLSIATGYWDLPGTQLIIKELSNYKSIRLLIGQEPLSPRYRTELGLSDLDQEFPDKDIAADLANMAHNSELRETISEIKSLVNEGILEVRVFRKSFLHAKCYIFGTQDGNDSVGIIGSSNFTAAGLTKNTELNSLEDDHRIVHHQPTTQTQEHGHISWFNEVWNDEDCVPWDESFTDILQNSPVGDLCYGPYDMYMRTLYELYKDEIVERVQFDANAEDLLYEFQKRNANLLINKLDRLGYAMLADSVGLGKTITAGAVIKHYREQPRCRVVVIAPASLTSQWEDDLREKHEMVDECQFISMQNIAQIEEERKKDRYAPVDLFIIDEAHNLRNESSKRFDAISDWITSNEESKVLLLTATPINNHLNDIRTQIQLAAKGGLTSFSVTVPSDKKIVQMDFFDAIAELSKEVNKAKNAGKTPNYEKVNLVMKQGLNKFMVRTTRSGIEKEFGGLRSSDGSVRRFPKTVVQQAPYEYDQKTADQIASLVTSGFVSAYGFEPRSVDITSLLDQTYRAKHPIDIVNELQDFMLMKTPTEPNVFETIFALILLLGFTPYKTQTYNHKYYAKAIEDMDFKGITREEKFKLSSQFTIHNLLRVNFLKRLESSSYSLAESLRRYRERLITFVEYLDEGKLLSISDINLVEKDLDDGVLEDVDFEQFDLDEIKINVDAIRADVDKDFALLELLEKACEHLMEDDEKVRAFASLVKDITEKQKAGQKVLVFSFFSDTVEYLSKTLPKYMDSESFESKAEYISGRTKIKKEDATRRFSPKSKGGLKKDDSEIDFLVSTDVLSEGQNLQDCGMLINFDLHWNPVRMIQRNGRINRLGSEFSEVFIYNMHPQIKLESYLKLVSRLTEKIESIKASIGTDQSILGEEENPIEFTGTEETDRDETSDTLQLYGENASEKLEQLELEEDQLIVDEDYINELRAFVLADSLEGSGDLERIKSIPQGKWGYIPNKTAKETPRAIGLIKTTRQLTKGKRVTESSDYVFVQSTTPIGHDMKVLAALPSEALALLRTTKDDNQRITDRISEDRNRFAKISATQALINAKEGIDPISQTQSVRTVYNYLVKIYPEIKFSEVFKKITTRSQQRFVLHQIRKAHLQLKDNGQVASKTLDALRDEAMKLLMGNTEEQGPEKSESVLFYARKL